MSVALRDIPNIDRDIIDFIIVYDEGGWVYTDKPTDEGGPTFAGASYRWFSKWYKTHYGKYLTMSVFKEWALAARNFHDHRFRTLIILYYYYEFIRPLQLTAFIAPVRKPLASACVNMGRADGVKLFQTVLNKHVVSKRKLQVDGIIGEKTIRACITFINPIDMTMVDNRFALQLARGVLLKNYFIEEWIRDYINNVQAHPYKLVNLEGWFNRAIKYLFIEK